MKTTIEISEAILRKAKALAALDGDTLRALVEQGLQKVIAERSSRRPRYRMPDASVDGKGLDPEFSSWDRLRDAIYEGRGG